MKPVVSPSFSIEYFFRKEGDAWGITTYTGIDDVLNIDSIGFSFSLKEIDIVPRNTERQTLADPWHPLLFSLICALAFALWQFRQRLGTFRTGLLFWLLGLLLWLLAGSPPIDALMVWGGAYLLWHLRREMTPLALTYAVFSFAIIFASGRTGSAERYAYGIVSLSIALGLLFQRYPRHGYLALGFFGILLASFGVRFAQDLWVG